MFIGFANENVPGNMCFFCQEAGWGSEENSLSQLTQSVDALLSHHTKLGAVNIENCIHIVHIDLQGDESLMTELN